MPFWATERFLFKYVFWRFNKKLKTLNFQDFQDVIKLFSVSRYISKVFKTFIISATKIIKNINIIIINNFENLDKMTKKLTWEGQKFDRLRKVENFLHCFCFGRLGLNEKLKGFISCLENSIEKKMWLIFLMTKKLNNVLIFLNFEMDF